MAKKLKLREGKWKAHINGRIGNNKVEISCIHTSDTHGMESWGWGGSTKYIIYDTDLKGVSKGVRGCIHKIMMIVAGKMADTLNKKV